MKEYLNLIVPCGISQLTNLEQRDIPIPGYKDFLKRLRSGSREQQETAYKSDEARMFKADLLEKIKKAKDKVDGAQKKWLGGELSTLLALQQRSGIRAWVPVRDFITLLRTDTPAGRFAAEVVREALVEIWQVPDDNDHAFIRKVVGWKPNLTKNDADTALGNLAEEINASLLESNEREEIHIYNILVATGGMRSTLPCLTIYSLLYRFEMVCLTEESDELLELRPAKADVTKRIDWDSLFKKERGNIGSMLQTYIIKVLDYRNNKKNTSWK